MKFTPSRLVVKQALSNHQYVGVAIGALMYLICLTGTIAVVYPELERWEQPQIPEYQLNDVDLAGVSRTVDEILGDQLPVTEHLTVTLPSEEMPRIVVANDDKGYFLNASGQLLDEVAHPWTEMLVKLHLYLHLPNNIGIVLVSVLGAVLCGLIVSGLLAHPNIIKDAFSLRLGGSKQLEQVDLHNRLSVWGLPFHMMIAVTGAYFGLALPVLAFVTVISDHSRTEMIESLFGAEPEIHQTAAPLNLKHMVDETVRQNPEATPFLVVFHKVGTTEQFGEVHARLPGRMIYSEQWRFDQAGNLIGKGGYSDGDTGKQAIYSIYRLHFGHFGGMGIKLIYVLLGIALTIVSVSGINIWLAKRRHQDNLSHIWHGFVWGALVGLVGAAIAGITFSLPPKTVFWTVVVAVVLGEVAGTKYGRSQTTRIIVQLLLALGLLVLPITHFLQFGPVVFSGAAGIINTILILLGVLSAGHTWRLWQRQLADAEPIATATLKLG